MGTPHASFVSLRRALVQTTCLCIALAADASATVTLNYDGNQSSLMVRSSLGSGAGAPHDTEVIPLSTIPFTASHDASLNGWTTTANYGLEESRFDFSFQQHTGSGSGSYTNAQGGIYFKVTQDTPYAISGGYAVTDYDPAHVESATHVFLQDWENGGTLLFGDRDHDIGPTPQSGSPTGMLQANHGYLLSYHFELWHAPPTIGNSLGAGSFSLVLPEPSAALCGNLLIVWGALGRPARSNRAGRRL